MELAEQTGFALRLATAVLEAAVLFILEALLFLIVLLEAD
jgi:hypothetical protein